MPDQSFVCPKLPNKIGLNPHSFFNAEVEAEPRGGGRVYSLEELRDSSSVQDSFYLTPGTGGFCAYPIRPLVTPHFSLGDFFPAETQNLPNLFGKPTSLVAGPDVSANSAIYDPYADQVFVPEVRGLNWYLVGGAKEYHTFIQGIVEYSQSLLQEWRAGPWQFLKKEWEAPEPQLNLLASIPSHLEAWTAMAPFMAWLSAYDATLFASVIQAKLQYAPQLPAHECQTPGAEEVYAYYTPAADQILLMPLAIRLLQDHDYTGLAQILAHEVAHRENTQAGLIIPSDQLMQRSLDLFFHSAAEENPYFGMAASLVGPQLWQELSCKRLPFLLEEEINAHSTDLEYGRSQPFLVQSEKMDRESSESLVWYIDQFDRHFPRAWRTLAADYVKLAQANHR